MNNKKFKWSRYIPKLNHLGEPYRPTDKQLAFMMLPHVEAMYGGAAGGGKALGINTLVVTPFGLRPLDLLKVGEKVSTPDGSNATIIGIYDQGQRPTYKITFQDGATVEADEEHLWAYSVARKGKWRKSGKEWKLSTTKQLVDQMATGREILTPVCEPIRFTKNCRYDLKTIDSWLLGALIGDGSFRENNVYYCSDDPELIIRAKALGYKWSQSKRNKTFTQLCTYDKGLVESISKLGLGNKKSHEKFIPDCYKFSSIDSRWELLRGLMDTDGYISEDGKTYYTTTSKQLAEDVKWLCSSLGGRASITNKIPTYVYEGDKHNGRRAYTVYLRLPDSSKCFSLERKVKRGKLNPNIKRKIVSIQPIGKTHCKCIKIDTLDGLFLVNDFVVTHNSDVLLMSALQYVDNPKYAGIIFRRALTDAELSGAIYARAKSWFAPFLESGEIRHVPRDNKFIFPSGAELSFGYLKNEMDHERYRSAEFQFIGFDELTTFEEFQYLFLFSRLRRLDGSNIPLRVRSGTNPSGIGLQWVKRRWRIMFKEGHWQGLHPHRKFIQAFVKDNSYIDESYQFSLHQLDPISRAQMAEGDWSCGEDSLFKEYYFSDRYTVRGSYFSALESRHTWHKDIVEIFFTVDPAGTQRSLPQGINIHKNKGPAWSVVCVWAKTGDGYLLLLDMIRKQCTIPDLLQRLMEAAKVYKPSRIIAERNGLGLGVTQVASWMGLPIDELHTSIDKVKNASNALFRASKKKIILPDDAPWLDDFEEEVFTWMGTPNETDDIIDNVSNAANYVQQCVGGQEREYFTDADDLPIAKGGWTNGITNDLQYFSY